MRKNPSDFMRKTSRKRRLAELRGRIIPGASAGPLRLNNFAAEQYKPGYWRVIDTLKGRIVKSGYPRKDLAVRMAGILNEMGYQGLLGATVSKNPLTSRERTLIEREAAIHEEIGSRLKRRKSMADHHRGHYYSGIAVGMRDIKEQYSVSRENPDLDACVYCPGELPRTKIKAKRLKDTRANRRRELSLYRALGREKKNPPSTMIYSAVIEIKATKAGMPHQCDAACKRANHCYVHRFKHGTNPAAIYGTPSGDLVIRHK